MRELCERWNLDFDTFHPEVPQDILAMMESAERGEIEFMWVIGTNPLVSLPDQNRSQRIMRRLFMVVQHPFVDAETVDCADIYFPAAMWGEKKGCVTNADRSVNLLLKAVEPPGEARSDFDIVVEIARRLGFKDKDGAPLIPFADPQDAFEEWRKVSKGRPCDYSGMTYELILEMGAVRWPCNAQHPRGCERLYEDLKFWTGLDECETYGARGLSLPHPHQDCALARTQRACASTLCRNPSRRRCTPADQYGGPGGAQLAERTLGRGCDGGGHGSPREVFAPFHYGRGSQAANQHTWYARDPVSLQPHLKSSPVAVRRLSFGQPEPWLPARLEELNGTSIVPFAARELDGTVNHTVPRQTRSEALPMQGGDGSP